MSRTQTIKMRRPEPRRAEFGAGAALLGAGAIGVALTMMRRRGGLAWVWPGAVLSAGVAAIADAAMRRRGERIDIVEELVETEIDKLDPLARAQVVREVAQHEVRRFMPGQAQPQA